METETITPRVYLACLACYNDGRLMGLWHDAVDVDALETHAEITGCLRDHEEYAIHDHEGFGRILGEYDALTTVAAIGQVIAEHGPAFLAWYDACDGHNYDADDMADAFQESYQGEWDSEKAFAEEWAVESACLIDSDHPLFSFIDWGHYANELSLTGFTFVRAGAPNYTTYAFMDR